MRRAMPTAAVMVFALTAVARADEPTPLSLVEEPGN